MSRITVRVLDGERVAVGGEELLAEAASARAAWVDVLEPDEASLGRVAAAFALHPLAVEDCLHFPQRPKAESYGDSLFLIWVVPQSVVGDGLELRELDVFVGARWLVTVHREPMEAIDRVAADAESYLRRGCDWTLHGVLDLAVDKVLVVLDALDDRIEDLEDAMLERADRADLEHLLETRRLLVSLHKVVVPERDALRELAREEALVSAEAYRYFQDIGDHLARVEDSVETLRDAAAGTMDIYLSSVSNRLNGIMKQLTIVATIFMPLTLISGIYGMNFLRGGWPPYGSMWGFAATISLMLTIAGGMWIYFRRKDWW